MTGITDPDRRRLESISALRDDAAFDAFAARLLGSLAHDPFIRRELAGRIEVGWPRFDALEDVAHRCPTRMFDLALEATPARGRILDWGCGNGSPSNFIGRDYRSCAGRVVVAVDIAEPSVGFPHHVTFIRSDLHAFQHDGPPFDLGLAVHVFEHVPDPERLAVRFRSFLGPGARALVAVPDARWFHDLLQHIWAGRSCDHVNAFTLESINAVMAAAGFELESHTHWPAHFTVMYGDVSLPGGLNLGRMLQRAAMDHARVHGDLSLLCYGHCLLYRAV